MKPSRRSVAGVCVLAGPAAALALGTAAMARADEPCAELKLSGATVLELPCPEELGRLLDSPLPQPPAGDDDTKAVDPGIAIDPGWPHDEAMIAEHHWPHDQTMLAPRQGDRDGAAPLIDDLLGLFGRFLSRGPAGRPPLNPHPRRARYTASGK